MEGLFTASSFIALCTLILLEVVLGIDNLIFIAILSEKLPPGQRDKARVVGLGLALGMRLILLSVMTWVISLSTPFFFFMQHPFSWRDIILITGGFFLLFKGTRELHERLESDPHTITTNKSFAGFWVVVAQIVVLDAVFSLDAVVTAVGMVKHLPIMITAVTIAMGIMLLAAKPLTKFVNAHPTIVVLCLSFLLLIGLTLIAEGLGYEIPKGYLYAAIGFSVLIEFFNQVALHNARKYERRKPMRLRTAEAVLRLLGSESSLSAASSMMPSGPDQDLPLSVTDPVEQPIFASEEVDMVTRVLTLSDRTVRSIMTHRADAAYIDIKQPVEKLREQLLAGTPSVLPVCEDSLDNILGTAYAWQLFQDIADHNAVQLHTLEPPHIVPESMRVINLFETLRKTRSHLVFVADEFGSIEGLITFMDVFEAIAGEVPEEGEAPPIEPLGSRQWRIAGTVDVHFLEHSLNIPGLVSESNDYTSIAGFLLAQLGRLPEPGETVAFQGFLFTIENVAERRITSVLVESLEEDEE